MGDFANDAKAGVAPEMALDETEVLDSDDLIQKEKEVSQLNRILEVKEI